VSRGARRVAEFWKIVSCWHVRLASQAPYRSRFATFWMALVIVVPFPAASDPSAVLPVRTQEEPITPIRQAVENVAKVALGERLFHDPRLSRDGTHSCASCHDLNTNGATGQAIDLSPQGGRPVLNTLTIFNAALNFRYNWEGGFRTLESQAAASIESSRIMGTSVPAVVGRLRSDPAMVKEFQSVYGHVPDPESLLDALATFERSLLTPDSRFDRWLRGEASALSAEEVEGYQLFKSLGCVSCHQGVNVGGNLFSRHGIFRPLASALPRVLRVPSLRNVEVTAPYFHDGSAPTLQDAIRRMGVSQLNSTLTDRQVDSIARYLKTLTGNYRGRPVRGAQ